MRFADIYSSIKKKYKGVLRDQLILICFKELNKRFHNEAKLQVSDAMETFSTLESKKAMTKWSKKQHVAFPFELEDIYGNTHKLDDYKNKIIVMDFWFTGCSWCKTLNLAMRPIIERYKNNPQIVFITVCEDKDKEQWKRSLSLGEYTSPGTINLYTNGQGNQHPIMKYYNFVGAPYQLIMGKNGLLVANSPPRPDMDNLAELKKHQPDPLTLLSSPNTKAFIKIIEDNLNSKKLGNN